ncbi:CbtA family protein [Nocardia cyriacigeorgica]|uniref:CbtA family protein n=2 Tax=Nocardia cyriacigeorgica TaxID=135487 RepID=UPI0018961124|nr:CbtA family protein [Nocardia cyriacigeorgica]MBF6453774.1 CbtA family protein [Nocardia cyriacigeorgica]MBF6550942.1 CbtA family protein [Nocardia cyriacigeorgica]
MPLIGTLRTLLLRGLLAGLIAGLLAGTVGYFVGEPKVEAAIAIEEAGAAAESGGHSHGEQPSAGHSHGDEEEPLVSRSGQQAGQFLALGLAGMAFGAIFGAVAHVARRYTALSGPKLTLGLGIGGWAAIIAVPFFKYPANPPAVGDPETINDRTLLWLAAVLLGLAAVGAGVYGWKLLAGRPDTLRLTAGVAAFVLLTTIGYIVLPGVNEVGADFPASLLWEFRISSLAVSTTLWACLGLGYAMLTEFASRTDAPVREAATAAG